MVYERVEQAHTDGIWQRAIQARLNMHQTVCTKIIKDLKKKHLIKEFTGNRQAGMAKKMLILSHLEPSDDNTGGAFFSDGELDVGLVEAVSYSVLRFVESASWAEQPGAVSHKKRRRDDEPQRPGPGVSTIDHASKRLKKQDAAPAVSASASDAPGATGNTTSQQPQPPPADRPKYKPHLSASSFKPLVPLAPRSTAYPTTAQICAHVRDIGVLTKALSLKFRDADFESVLDMLAFDGRIERVKGSGDAGDRWRSVRKSFEEWTGAPTWPAFAPQREGGIGNGVSEAPCGRCPVFDLCTPGGPVNPEGCKYYDEWLEMF
ncbi:MAG: hypothetical protein INR71_00800 [Terriglobus roseus]|nr:hypothetical protein [Terriglobus roseus]